MAVAGTLRAVERDARIYRRTWRGTVVSQFVGPLLFLGAMGVGLGGLVDSRSGDVEGLTYLEFVTPGLLAATAVMMGAGESLWPTMGGFKWLRYFHAMASSPLTPGEILGGRLAWGACREAMSAAVFLVVALALGGVISPWAVLAVPAAVLTALAFAAPLTAWAATRETDQPFLVMMRVGIQPLFLFSGTFFPISQLPDGLEALAVLSPLWHGVELCRAATTGHGEALELVGHVVVLVALVVVGVVWGRRTFAARLAA